MIDYKDIRLATDPTRPLTAEQQRQWAAIAPRLDLPEAYGVPTHNGGHLKLSSKDGTVTIVVDGLGQYAFFLQLTIGDFQDFFSGGCRDMPGVGTLIATLRGHDSVRLCLVPARKVRGGPNVSSFTADLILSAVFNSLSQKC